MICHAILAATEQNKHIFRCSEKPGQTGKGWGYSGVLMDNAEMARMWRKKRKRKVMCGLVNPVSAGQETVQSEGQRQEGFPNFMKCVSVCPIHFQS